MRAEGVYYTAGSPRRQPVSLQMLPDGAIVVHGEGLERRYRLDSTQISDRVGNVIRTLRFDDGSLCEVADNNAIDRYIAEMGRGTVSTLIDSVERRWLWVLAGLAGLVVIAVLFVSVAVPRLAKMIAFTLPAKVDDQLGREGLELMDRVSFEPTTLDPMQQQRLKRILQSLAQTAGMSDRVELVFRDADDIGPNAFALPSGTVIVTDQLVTLAQSDQEIAAVLAHELGHVDGRHTMRMILQDSITALMFAVVLGDLTSISALAGAVPTVLVQKKYSRDFETEADIYALTLMDQAGIDPENFVAILRRMESVHAGDTAPDFLSSHPATEERLQRFRR